jgi:uncharacterized protein YndB with AHSA1/START domain
MAPIVVSTEISRSPDDVFAYVTDPSHLPEWQESAVKVEVLETTSSAGTKKARVTRRVGRREMTMTAELTPVTPPTHWTVRGVDGPVRGNVDGTIQPLDDGRRSRVTIALDFQGHGIGKLLIPLFVKRRVQDEMPRSLQTLKERLERTAPAGGSATTAS